MLLQSCQSGCQRLEHVQQMGLHGMGAAGSGAPRSAMGRFRKADQLQGIKKAAGAPYMCRPEGDQARWQ